MPHFYISTDAPLLPVSEQLPRYLELSGINLHSVTCHSRHRNAIELVLRTKEAAQPVTVYHTPWTPSVQMALCLARTLAQLQLPCGVVTRSCSCSGRQVVMTLCKDTMPDPDALSRVIAHAAARFFRLPELPARPERPASLDVAGSAALRSYPSDASQMHHRIAPGAQLSVLGSSGSWLLVRHGETVGFLPASRVRMD